jgi:aspartyl-tRNA(Asn)/glutamyl-tRNA(Gln) amidotransferase subunit A
MTKLMNKPISELHELLVKKEITPVDLVNDCIAGVKSDDCNCFEALNFDGALKEAGKITEIKEEEYLKGIPYFAKDNYSTKGIETTASSNILNGYVPVFDATVISKLNRAGMIMVAKTTMDELAMGGTGTTGHKGSTLNPYDHSRIIGGSSCGSASSLALGLAPLALGSDTGDSVRKPASNGGLVGYKATWGRISRYGLFPFAPSLDAVGFFTRNVLDASYVLSALSGHDRNDMSSSYRKREKYENYVLGHKTLKKIGYFKAVMDSISDKTIKDSYVDLLNKLKAKGYEVIAYDYPVELLDALYPTYMIISCAEATSNDANLDGIRFGPTAKDNPKTYSEYMTECRTKGFSDLIKRRFVIGSFSLLSQNQEEMFSRAQKARRLIVNNLNRFFDSIDYLVQPASFAIPKKFSELSTAWSTHPDFLDNILTLGNFGGNPSLTLPMAFESGMPLGINVTGRIFEDGYVMGLGQEIENITGLKNLTVKEAK